MLSLYTINYCKRTLGTTQHGRKVSAEYKWCLEGLQIVFLSKKNLRLVLHLYAKGMTFLLETKE